MGLGRLFTFAALVLATAGGALAQPAAQTPAPPASVAKEYNQQFLVAGSWFHGIHGIAFNKDDQLFAGSVLGQTIYRVQIDTGEVDTVVGAPNGMADDIAFADDGTMAWTAFLLGKVYIRKPNGKTIEVANGMAGPNSLAFTKDGRLFVSEVFLGDALYEVDLKNVDKPEFKSTARGDMRRVAEKLGGLNGFEIHRNDGFLYGPLWFKGQAVKINIETGAVEVIASGFKTPAAANFDPQNPDNLYVVDAGSGAVWSVSLTSKARKLVASLKPGLDNLAFDSRGRLFVTSEADNGIYLVDKQTGSAKTVIEGKLAIPSDIAVVSDNGHETVHVADVFSYRTVDGQSGAVSDVLRVHGDTNNYPIGISVGPKNVLLSSWFSNTVEKVDRKTGKLVATLGDFASPGRCDRSRRRHDLCGRAGERQPREGERRRQAAQHHRQGVARARRDGTGSGQRGLCDGNRRRRREPGRRGVGRAQGRGRRSGRSRGHRRRPRRQALRGRGRPEAHRVDRPCVGRQDGDRVEPRYRPRAVPGRPAGAGADRRGGRQVGRGLCQLRHSQRFV